MENTVQLFPIFGTRRYDGSLEQIPMEPLLPYEDRCIKVHGKTFAELAEGRGLTYLSLYCLVKDITWDQAQDLHFTTDDVRDALFELLNIKLHVVPVEWVVCGLAGVYACNAKQALHIMQKDNMHISLPYSPYAQYVEDTFKVGDYPDNIEEGAALCEEFTKMYEQQRDVHLLNYLTD